MKNEATVTVGQTVTYSGFRGTVQALPVWAPGMAEVLLRSGLTCVPVIHCLPVSK